MDPSEILDSYDLDGVTVLICREELTPYFFYYETFEYEDIDDYDQYEYWKYLCTLDKFRKFFEEFDQVEKIFVKSYDTILDDDIDFQQEDADQELGYTCESLTNDSKNCADELWIPPTFENLLEKGFHSKETTARNEDSSRKLETWNGLTEQLMRNPFPYGVNWTVKILEVKCEFNQMILPSTKICLVYDRGRLFFTK